MGTILNKLILCVVAVAVLVASALAAGSETSAEIERLAESVEANPKSIDARMEIAAAYLSLFDRSGDLGHVVLAESAAYHALEIDNRHVPGLNLMSRALAFEGRFTDVLFVQNWSIVVDIENAQSWELLGDAFMELGKYRNADSSYNQMMQLDDGFHSRVRLAARDFDIGDVDSAAERLSQAISAAGAGGAPASESGRGISGRDMALAYDLLARMSLARGDLKKSLDAADASLGALPGFVDALVVKAAALRCSREFSAARTLLESSIDASRQNGGLLDAIDVAGAPSLKLKTELARVYRDCRWRHRSKPLVRELTKDYERLYALYPNALRRDYAWFLLEWDIDPKKALALATEESRDRKDVNSYNCLARAYYQNGMTELAWSVVSFALRKGTNRPEILYNAALIAKALGNTDKYETFSERVRQINPNYERIYGSF